MTRNSLATVAVGLALSASGVMAQEKTNSEIIVTAARVTRETFDVPANVTVITSDDIQDAGSVSLADVLNKQCGVEMRNTSGPATADISMRGFGENSGGRVLVLLDGRRLNSPDMSPVNWLGIPISNVDRVEIVRGSGSALYGNNAIAGVINIITKKGTQETHFDVSEEIGSYGMNSARLGVSGSAGALSCSANGERYASDGFRDRSAFSSGGGKVSVGYDINDSLSASLDASMQSVDYQLPGYLTKTQMDADPTQAQNQDDSSKNQYFNADIGINAALPDDQRLSINVSYGRKDMTSDMASWFSFADVTIDTFGVTPQYSFEGSIFKHADKVVAGIDYYNDELNVDRFADKSHDSVTTSARVTRDTLGAYLRNELTTFEGVVLGVGARAETAETSADVLTGGSQTVDDSKKFNETAIDASLIKTFANKSKVYAKGGTVYRYPFVDEQVSYIGFGSDMFNPDLRPEEGWNAEVGTEVNAAKGLVLGFNLFRLDMDNEIAYDYVIQGNKNMARTTHQGVETYFDYSALKFVTFNGNYTLTRAQFTSGANDGNDVPMVPEHKVSGGIKFLLPLDLALDATAIYTGASYLGGDESNVGPKLAGYTVANLFLRYTPKALHGFEAYVGTENIFDKQYASLGYKGMTDDAYYPAVGRTFRGGAAYRF
jgi:iron complex outermembrane recepter protein